jgi:putative endonuclease
MYYFYVLQSQKDFGYYYDSSTNLKRRVEEHIAGKVKASKYRQPVELIYYEAYLTEKQTRERERQVKKSGSVRNSLLKRISTGH